MAADNCQDTMTWAIAGPLLCGRTEHGRHKCFRIPHLMARLLKSSTDNDAEQLISVSFQALGTKSLVFYASFGACSPVLNGISKTPKIHHG